LRIRALNYLRDLLTATESADHLAPVELNPEQILAVLEIGRFLPNATPLPVRDAGVATLPGLASSDLWFEGGQVTSAAGGAGQFSGTSRLYEADQVGNALDLLQIVYLRVVPSVAAILRLAYDTVDIFGASGDLANMADNLRSNTDGPAGQDWGFEGVNSQTNTPDTTSLGANHSAHQVRGQFNGLLAGVAWEWPLSGVPLFSRTIGAGNQARALSWGVWAAATVTAITVDYAVILRKLP